MIANRETWRDPHVAEQASTEAATIVSWLRLLVDPEHVVELRALKCQSRTYRRPHTRSGYFDHQHLDAMAQRALELSCHEARGVYMTLNPVHRDLHSRRYNRDDVVETETSTADANIIARRWLLVDVDPARIADIGSTDAEKAMALDTIEAVRSHLQQSGWPVPVLADSGNGYHLLYRVELPVDDGSLVKRSLKALAKQFDTDSAKIDTSVYNPSRIVKLYGTVSRKGDDTPERPHRRSCVVEVPDELLPVPVERIESLAATAPVADRSPIGKPRRNGDVRSVVARARKYLAALPRAISGQHGHASTFRAACALVLGFDLDQEIAYPLLEDWNQTHCVPPWSEHELRHKLADADKKTGERGHLLRNGRDSSTRDKRSSHSNTHDRTGGADLRTHPDHDASATGFDVPVIDAGNHDLKTVTAEAWDAISAANALPFLFRYGGLPGRLERDDRGKPIVQLVEENRLRHILARVARWKKTVRRGDEDAIVDAMPPKDVVKDVLATPDMPLPILTRIVEAPVVARDGTLQTSPGYHPASQTLFVPAPGFCVPPVSDCPSTDEIGAARSLLCDDLLVDFPFTDPAERAHSIALLLLPFARDLIDGSTPLHLFEKPMPGTGATLLVDMLSHPMTGRPIPTMTEGRDDEEWRKRLTAKLRNSPQFLLIDNFRRRLDSGVVSAAITSTVWEDRILSKSVMLRVVVRCCWLATANNPAVSSEMSRRIIRIRLDAKTDRPWLRGGFKHPDLRRWVRENRNRLAWAALTLIQAWIAAKRPRGILKLGMFEDWSEVMGGILANAGIPGFLANVNEFYEESDAEGEQWRSFVMAWWRRHHEVDVRTSELFQLLGVNVELALGDGSEQSRKVRLGQTLASARDRVFALDLRDGGNDQPIQVRIRRGDKRQGAFMWRLEEISG